MNISRRKTVSKRERKARKFQKKARKLQKQKCKQKKNPLRRKKLTAEQKKRRSEQIIQQKELKQKRKKLSKDKNCTEEIDKVQSMLNKIFNPEILNQIARSTGFIKRHSEITAFSFMYIMSFGFLGNGEIVSRQLKCQINDN